MIISTDEIHIWQAPLNLKLFRPKQFFQLLSRDEKEQAEAFLLTEFRDRYVVARGVLRLILSHYLQSTPEELLFSYNLHGKPFLHNNEVFFNLSHSDGLVLYGISSTSELGVDIEKKRTDFAWQDIAAQILTAAECSSIERLPKKQRHEALFSYWVQKEALLKAVEGP